MTDHTLTRAAALELPIEELELGVRVYNVLKRLDVNTIGDLLKVEVQDVLDWNKSAPDYQRLSYVDVVAAQLHAHKLLKGLQ